MHYRKQNDNIVLSDAFLLKRDVIKYTRICELQEYTKCNIANVIQGSEENFGKIFSNNVNRAEVS